MACERLLIATTDDKKSNFLRRYLAQNSPRFELQCTNDPQTLQVAMRDESISAVVADSRMIASCRTISVEGGPEARWEKPVVLSPSLSRASSAIRQNSSHLRNYLRDELNLLNVRLNHAVDQWRRGGSDRRLICGHGRLDSCRDHRGPMSGFLEASAIDDLQRRNNPLRDRRQILGCVTFHFTQMRKSGHGSEAGISSAAGALRPHMRRCDVGIRWDDRTLVILRPSSPLGECWLWAEEMRTHLETVFLKHSRSISVAGMSVQESPTAGLCAATIKAGVASAHRSANQKGGSIQTPMMLLLESRTLWQRLRSLPPPARRTQLLESLTMSLGNVQLEHIGAHCELVSNIAGEIAKFCGLDSRNVETAKLAGLYHDVGKMLVPNDILAKPGPLTEAEKTLMMRHTHWGADICGLLRLGTSIRDAVRDHHARFEQSGYGVSLFGRIVSVADAIATMAVRREYCPAQPMEVAMEELRRQRGKQFDPVVVDSINGRSLDLKIEQAMGANN
jgi:putative nucleotidyltransferase with HDIG domain